VGSSVLESIAIASFAKRFPVLRTYGYADQGLNAGIIRRAYQGSIRRTHRVCIVQDAPGMSFSEKGTGVVFKMATVLTYLTTAPRFFTKHNQHVFICMGSQLPNTVFTTASSVCYPLMRIRCLLSTPSPLYQVLLAHHADCNHSNGMDESYFVRFHTSVDHRFILL
jgi:hypothetical protein